jgi:hypothetical protein
VSGEQLPAVNNCVKPMEITANMYNGYRFNGLVVRRLDFELGSVSSRPVFLNFVSIKELNNLYGLVF